MVDVEVRGLKENSGIGTGYLESEEWGHRTARGE